MQPIAHAAGLTVDTAKQVISQQLLKLRPDGVSERNVLFQQARAGAESGNSYQFVVTVLIRDYEPGYPRNRYYGQTCVARLDNEQYTLWSGGGEWHVDGRLTPDLSTKTCKPNPDAGVSSIPVQGLPGAPAGAGPMAAAPAPARSTGGVAEGPYVCWAFKEAVPGLNFTIRSGGQYLDNQGKAGTFTVDANARVTFHGGAVPGSIPDGMYAAYYEPQGRPTVSIRNATGDEAVACQKQ